MERRGRLVRFTAAWHPSGGYRSLGRLGGRGDQRSPHCFLSPALLCDDHLRAHRAELLPQGGVLQLHAHVILRRGRSGRGGLFGVWRGGQQPWWRGFGRHVAGGGVEWHVVGSLPICGKTDVENVGNGARYIGRERCLISRSTTISAV